MERATAKGPRRRLSLSVRGLMLLVLGLGVWLGWQVRLAREQREAAAALTAYGGVVRFDWELGDGLLASAGAAWVPDWLRRAIGDDFFQSVVEVNMIYADRRGKPILTARELEDLASKLSAFPRLRHLDITPELTTDRTMDVIEGLTELETLRIWGHALTEAGFAKIRSLRNLKVLQVNVLEVDDAELQDDALAHLAPLVRLEHLDLSGNPITDAGLVHLKGLKSLAFLNINRTRVSDAGLEELRGLVNLKEVWVGQTAVTGEGWERFCAKMPNVDPDP
ncbi:leucine-rich repeat domain-containing protein [Planctomyces sp. SH-PL62]|uniref:leucine-rich repeat domain-containing protein n=1 Tax=Planctomyces sp. SH-PL62 TaxID=1636152 RepID=UPI00078B92E5|nr:hypothetical protein [Planctomyces sp. SH-PL62]AMV36474.1 Leucine Rich repeats (2 copies) [Planctomyces sp. SH-PL62]